MSLLRLPRIARIRVVADLTRLGGSTAHGLVVKQNVSRNLDLLVVADPDSLSGKAKKARECGSRIIAERAFWRAIGVEAD